MIATRRPAVEAIRNGSHEFTKILLAFTKSTAPKALDLVRRVVKPGASHVKVLHLQQRLTYPSRSGMLVIETYQQAVDFAAKVQAELREMGVDAEVQVGREVSGHEAEQILTAATEFDADLIIAGNRRKSTLDSILRGSTTRDLVRKTNIPVLLVN